MIIDPATQLERSRYDLVQYRTSDDFILTMKHDNEYIECVSFGTMLHKFPDRLILSKKDIAEWFIKQANIHYREFKVVYTHNSYYTMEAEKYEGYEYTTKLKVYEDILSFKIINICFENKITPLLNNQESFYQYLQRHVTIYKTS